jgi:hypothetical protein
MIGRVLFAALLAFSACALPSKDDFATVAPDGGSPSRDVHASIPDAHGDAPVTPLDGAADADAAPSEHEPSLLTGNASTFENGNCNDSGTYRSKFSASNDAHSGTSSCRVCRDGNGGLYTMDTYVLDDDIQPGAAFTAQAWVKRPTGSQASDQVFLALRISAEDYTQLEEHESEGMTLTDQWQPITFTTTFSVGGHKIDTYLGSSPPAGSNACYLVDDYEVWKAN